MTASALPSLSVVLATYNGAAYLPDQLRSLAAQQVLPHELVCFDDASRDDTVAVLESFARTAPFPVRIHTRTVNVGPNQNFDAAIRLATGDVVLCCDQDDVWHPHKLAAVGAAFADDPGLGLLLNDASIVHDDLRDAGETLWQLWGLDGALQHRIATGDGFRVFSQHVPPYGCTMSFRSALVPLVPPVPAAATFDLWFGRMLSVLADVRTLPEPLQLYRQHRDQVTGFEMRTMRGRLRAVRRQAQPQALIENLERTRQAAAALGALGERTDRLVAAERWLGSRQAFDEARMAIRKGGPAGLPHLIRLVLSGSYTRLSTGWRGALVDLVGLTDRAATSAIATLRRARRR